MDAAKAMGSIALWGFSPAVDFTVDKINPGAFEFWNKETCDVISVLFVGVPDLSHILQNLPEVLRRTDRPLDFFILENSVEVYARQLLLLWLMCEPPDVVGLHDKVWMFLEIVGNTLVRPSTAQYVVETATKLIALVTGGDDCAALPLVSLAELRHRERDQLAAVFQFWRTADNSIDVTHMWDLRLRQQLAQRYDARHGVFDWDYFMRLKDRLDIEFVQPQEYKHWRETGVAFRRPGTEQTCVNRTLVTTRALGRPGERQLRRGYWGDIVSGPYASFGLRSDDPSLSRKQNGRLAANAARVSAANLEALFSSVSASLSSASHVRVRLLPADGGVALGRRVAYRGRFAAAVFSSGMSHLLTPATAASFQDGAVVMLETARYVVCVTAEQQGRLLEKYDELADTAGCRSLREQAVDAGDEKQGASSSRGSAAASHSGQVHDQQVLSQKVCVSESEEGRKQSGKEEVGEDDSRPENRNSMLADSDAVVKPVEIMPSEIGKLQAFVTEEGLQRSAHEATAETMKADSQGACDVEQEPNAVKSAEDMDVGDLSMRMHNDGDRAAVVANNVKYDNRSGAIENGAGEPKVSGAAPECGIKELTPIVEDQWERSQSKVEPTVTEGANNSAAQDTCHQEKSDSSQLGKDTVSDNPDSNAAQTGDSSETELGGTRRWASDKLSSLPEWVCFVKRPSDDVVA